LAKCKLNLTHPSFVKITEKLGKRQHDFGKGLEQAKRKIETDHQACNWVNQPMPGYPDCQDKIWKYDWGPPSIRSSTRRPCRLIVIVKDQSKEPYELVAGTVYCKNSANQLSVEELAAVYSEITNPLPEQSDLYPDDPTNLNSN
jgi:hypothetical protein